jgi:hypothetical protein
MMLAGGACKRRQQRAQIQQTEEEPPQMATLVHMADARSSAQLVSGFYDIEQNAWRWTAGKFSVVLRTPRGAAQKGAVLRLQFALPAVVIGRLKAVSLSAAVGGVKLASETYTQTGEFVFTRDVPANTLGGESTRVDFALDKFLPTGMVESRELGVIASSVGLESK